jgi:hypothetical protein
VAAGGALVDAHGQGPHAGDAFVDFLAQEHAAAAGFGALAEHDFDGVGLTEVVRVHAVAGREVLVDEVLGLAALLRRHAAVAGGCGCSHLGRAAPERLFGVDGQGAEAHAGDGYRGLQVQRPARVAVTEDDVGFALFAVALQGVAGHRRAKEQQVIEVRDLALGAPAADVIDAGGRGPLDVRDGGPVKRGGLAQAELSGVPGRERRVLGQ